ncbi:hypothetical protein A6A05_16450 [Magnetospirillum moscoviense]|uniref:AAA+ ATPase domain-containing protein n=1 Tax=Magnetospirillum moscoviense TaxID=1437059 RepID=A0A178MC29_9PROT|nr:hypothetical protein A6A05_16450 [Magnetospirillum moscoviense]
MDEGFHPRNRLLTVEQIMALPPADWVVKSLVPADAIGVLYGKPGAGKTFFALSVVLSIAHGLTCFGRKTVKGNAVIVSGEGGRGLQNRTKAWHQHHGLPVAECGNVRILPHACNMMDADAVEHLIQDIHHHFDGQRIELVVFDTLSRCFGDGDENRQGDMARFVEAVELVRRALGCTVLVVHHTPKEADELRGSSVLEGACDFVLRAGKTSLGMELFVRKMKDGRDGLSITYQMGSACLGIDGDGEAMNVPVAVLEGTISERPASADEASPTGKNQQALLSVLGDFEMGLTEAEWRQQAKDRSAFGGAKPPASN